MNTNTSKTSAMKEDMTAALQQSAKSAPSVISLLIDLLTGAQAALRENGYGEAVLELRQGLQTNIGLRYTAYLRNASETFEQSLFSVFVGDDHCAFQADGKIQDDLSADNVLENAHDYLLKPHVVEFITGLLRQFGKSPSTFALKAS